jgi:hypothetical protein
LFIVTPEAGAISVIEQGGEETKKKRQLIIQRSEMRALSFQDGLVREGLKVLFEFLEFLDKISHGGRPGLFFRLRYCATRERRRGGLRAIKGQRPEE